jgi:hypothetical protein
VKKDLAREALAAVALAAAPAAIADDGALQAASQGSHALLMRYARTSGMLEVITKFKP